MKRASILVAFFFLLPLSIVSITLQNGYDLFQKALVLERAAGKLQEAIVFYQRIVDESDDKSLSAKAQLRVGICHEKMGQLEAQVAYQKVIDNYPQQQQEVAQARERIAKLVAASKEVVTKPTFRKIQMASRLRPDAQFSPDGKSLAFVNNSWLWIAPISSDVGPGYLGVPKQLDTQGIEVDWCGFTWSGDGQWIAFNGAEVKEARQKIYVVPAVGGKPREIYENNRDVRIVNYRMSLSQQGQTIAFSSMDANVLHIYKMSVEGGAPERLVDDLAREPVFSPDGRMIAYVEDKNLGRGGGGLWVAPAEGGTPKLVADAGTASSPVWSPDGRMIAFLDDGANKKIHIVQLGLDGNPIGEKTSIDYPEGIGDIERLAGWTPDNQIGAIVRIPTEFALYAQPVEGGTATFVTHGGYPMQPRWSPDGKRIYHVNNGSESSGDWAAASIAYVPSEGGEVNTIPLHSEAKIRLQAYGTGDLISPDGRTIVFAGYKSREPITIQHIWTLPVDGGTPTQLTDEPFIDWYPCWSPDGQEIAFMRSEAPENWNDVGEANIYIVSVNGGEPRQITSDSDRVYGGPVTWSPDGKFLAYFSRDEDSVDGTLRIMPVEGGESRIVAKPQRIFANKEMAWSPDGGRIAFNAPKTGSLIKLVSLDDGIIEEVVPDLKGVKEIYHLDWSPDGKTLVFGGYTGGGREFLLMEDFLHLVKR